MATYEPKFNGTEQIFDIIDSWGSDPLTGKLRTAREVFELMEQGKLPDCEKISGKFISASDKKAKFTDEDGNEKEIGLT